MATTIGITSTRPTYYVNGGKGFVQVVVSGTSAHIWGSLDDATFFLLDNGTFSSSALKSMDLPPYIRASGSSSASDTTLGSTVVKIHEIRTGQQQLGAN